MKTEIYKIDLQFNWIVLHETQAIGRIAPNYYNVPSARLFNVEETKGGKILIL